jgi:amino acid transporter
MLGVMNFVIPLGVALSTFGCALSIQFGVTRLCYVAGREGHMLAAFSFIHMRRLTPAPAVILQVSDTVRATYRAAVLGYGIVKTYLAVAKFIQRRW